jgi:acetylglutamate kinase
MHNTILPIKHDPRRPGAPAPVVIKLGGAAIDEAGPDHPLWCALADLHLELPGGVVLVHGGGAAIDRRLDALGITSERIDGVRITTPEMIDEIVGVLAGSVSSTIVGRLQRRGVPAAGLTMSAGFFARAEVTRRYAFDAGRVGDVVGGSPCVALALLGAGCMPVFSCVGLDGAGEPLNINADDAAAGAASILRASALILLTDVDGVLDASGAVVGAMTSAEVEARIASGEIRGGMIPKARSAAEIAARSNAPCVIASWKRPENLALLAAGEGLGTWLTHEPAPAQEVSS